MIGYNQDLRRESKEFADKYEKRLNYLEKKRLDYQVNKGLKRIDIIRKQMKKLKGFQPEIDYIDEKIIPYLELMKFIPQSHQKKLNQIETRLKLSKV